MTARAGWIAVLVSAGLCVSAAAQQQEAGQRGGAALADRFKQADRNGDGKLSREDVDAWPGLMAGFDVIDTSHDGGISLDELKTAVAQWQQRRAEAEEPPVTAVPPKQVAPPAAPRPAPPRPATVDTNSPQFRGPRGDGVAYGANLPDTWSPTSNVVWTCAIPGKGWSSPVIWGERVFVTSALGPGSVEAPPQLHRLAEHVNGVSTPDEHQYLLHCVEWSTGKLLWSRGAHKGVPPGLIHPKNSYASETPVTEGERIYAKQRFTTGKAAFTASPWAYDGKILCLAETGETYVVAAGPEFRVLQVNRLDEATLATPAVARDSLILRTLTKLYRIANTAETKKP